MVKPSYTRTMTAYLGSGSRTDRLPYAVLDVETNGLRGELVYWAAGCECNDRMREGTTAASLWAYITSHNRADENKGHKSPREHLWWAHNGGEYDYVYLFDPAKAAAAAGVSVKLIARDDRVIGLEIRHGHHTTILRDSYALLPASLRALSETMAPEHVKGDIGLADGVVFDPENPEHRAYCQNDVRATLAVLKTFRAYMVEHFGVMPSSTVAATALRAWRTTLPADTLYRRLDPEAEAFARNAYYGGMVHLGSIVEAENVVVLDVNSMYPSVMRASGVPAGWYRWTDRAVPGSPAIYEVDVNVPEGYPFTFLPKRTADGLLWPTGTFRTTLTSAEYDAAIAAGFSVSVIRGLVFERIDHPFRAFVDRVETMRQAGGVHSMIGKLLGNSLYGKFGSKTEGIEYVIADSPPGPEWFPPAAYSEDPERYERVFVRSVHREAGYMLPHWAAWITASARLTLIGLARMVGLDRVIYTDTDSLVVPEAAITQLAPMVGSGFGNLKVEGRFDRFRVIAPKCYRGVTDTGVVVAKAKGIPRDQRIAAIDHPTVAVEWTSPTAARRVLMGGPMTSTRNRRLTNLSNSAGWRIVNDDVVPVHLHD